MMKRVLKSYSTLDVMFLLVFLAYLTLNDWIEGNTLSFITGIFASISTTAIVMKGIILAVRDREGR